MSKTAPIPGDIHALIIDKQTELKKRHKIYVKISDIIALVMKNNIHKVGEYLGFKNDEESNTVQGTVDEEKKAIQDTDT